MTTRISGLVRSCIRSNCPASVALQMRLALISPSSASKCLMRSSLMSEAALWNACDCFWPGWRAPLRELAGRFWPGWREPLLVCLLADFMAATFMEGRGLCRLPGIARIGRGLYRRSRWMPEHLGQNVSRSVVRVYSSFSESRSCCQTILNTTAFEGFFFRKPSTSRCCARFTR